MLANKKPTSFYLWASLITLLGLNSSYTYTDETQKNSSTPTITTRSTFAELSTILEKLTMLEDKFNIPIDPTSFIDIIANYVDALNSKSDTIVNGLTTISSDLQQISQDLSMTESELVQDFADIQSSAETLADTIAIVEANLATTISSAIETLSTEFGQVITGLETIKNTTETTASSVETISDDTTTISSMLEDLESDLDQGITNTESTIVTDFTTFNTNVQAQFNTVDTNISTVNTNVNAIYANTVAINNKLNTLSTDPTAPTPIHNTGGPITISQPGSYCLANSILVSTSDSAAITINADNVTLDLNGYLIKESGQNGIDIKSTNHKEIIIKNGFLDIGGSGFTTSISLTGCSDVTIENITSRLGDTRISLSSCSRVTIDSFIARSIQSYGIYCIGCQEINIKNSIMQTIVGSPATEIGIYMTTTSNSKIYNCLLATNKIGIELDGCSQCLVQDCLASSNAQIGFSLVNSAASANNVIEYCNALTNTSIGFYDDTLNNQYYNNAACGNGTNYDSNVIASSVVTSNANAHSFANVDCTNTDPNSNTVIINDINDVVISRLDVIVGLLNAYLNP